MRFDSHGIYNPINYDLEELISRAESGKYLPKPLESNTASAFASWVFYLCHIRHKVNDDFEEITFQKAKKREFEISESLKNLDGVRGFSSKGDWKLIYQDPIDTNSSSIFFIAPNLSIKNVPMNCRPDVVLFNETSANLLIIERKVAITSNAFVPNTCYPNILAQLWCYSQIDFDDARWPKSSLITLAAELWTHTRSESELDGGRICWAWQKNARDFKYIEILFSIYKRHFESLP